MSQPAEKALSRGMPGGFDWFILLTKSFRLSVSGRCLGLALCGILVTTMGWKLVGWIMLPVLQGDREIETTEAFHSVISAWPGAKRDLGLPEELVSLLPNGRSTFVPIDPVRGVPFRLVEPFRRAFTVGRSWASLTYYALGGFVSLAIWALFGGAITRMAVVQIGLRRSIRVPEAAEFGIRQWVAFFSAPALPLVGIVMLALPFVALGGLMRLDVGVLFAGIVWAGVLLAGLLMTILGLGLMFCWPLMWGTISTEDSDAFDAISRSYAYTFQRPLHYLFYALMASILGSLGWLVAWWFAESVVSLSFWAVSFGCGPGRGGEIRAAIDGGGLGVDATPAFWMGALLVRVAVGLVRAMASAFSFSYFWSVAGAVYLLLRRDTDQTQLDDMVFSAADMTELDACLNKEESASPSSGQTSVEQVVEGEATVED